MEFILNGKAVSAEPAEDTSLLELLRTELGVRSVKDGCAPEGSCGACTVIVEGRAVVSCAQKATRFEGKHVVDPRGPLRGRAPALERELRRGRRVAVRVLLARDRDEGRGAAAEASRADAGRDRARAARQPLPLHRLRQGDRRDRARGRGPPRRAAPRARPQRPRRLAHRALPGHRARARRQRVRRRHGGARHAPRRPPVLGPPARADSPDRHLEGARGARRRRRRHGRRRARASASRDRSSATGASSWRRARSPRTSAT